MLDSRHWMRLRKWARYATGQSYQHVPQGIGQVFVPGALAGYFNDLTGKADWRGATGAFGVPVVRTDTVASFAFPIVIFQWALGNWDWWLLNGDRARLGPVLAAAQWARETITSDGGWACWTGLKRPVTSVYSAMAQGQGLSVLSRAAEIDPAGGWLELAGRACRFMLNDADAGLLRVEDGVRYLEEYPGAAMRSVLNGWLFALAGVHDHALATGDAGLRALSAAMAGELAQALPRYDTGYWSSYDLSGNLASPFYHHLHVAQLQAAALLFPAQAEVFAAWADRFAGYADGRVNVARAVAGKLVQKLRQADVGEMA